MKLQEALTKLGAERAIEMARKIATEEQSGWEQGARFIFAVVAANPVRAPSNIGDHDDTESEAIRKWFRRYKNGVESRASQRISNPPGTVADPVIEKIMGARLKNLSEPELQKITFGHRLAMSAENILGLLLEEYLSVNLQKHRWHVAWGETVRSVDLVNEDGRLMQIKNRSNSENSSSKAIRKGTKIERWYRIEADEVQYKWDVLNEICKTDHLSEPAFVQFITRTLAANPACLAVEEGNPWAK